jgi:hypothetical protein
MIVNLGLLQIMVKWKSFVGNRRSRFNQRLTLRAVHDFFQGLQTLILIARSYLRILFRGGSWKKNFQWDVTASTSYPGFVCFPAYSSRRKKSSIFIEWYVIQWHGTKSVGIADWPEKNHWYFWKETLPFFIILRRSGFPRFRAICFIISLETLFAKWVEHCNAFV